MTDSVNNAVNDGTFGVVVQTGNFTGTIVHQQPVSVRPPLPRQLPPDPRVWVDREHELQRLAAACRGPGGSARRVVISGPGGLGKTALAARLIRLLDADAGGAQVVVDLRGHPGQIPLPPAHALQRFLRAFGYGLGTGMPDDLDELSGWWRSVTAERPVAMLADNAADGGQVAPLLPASADSLVVVTSRHPLPAIAMDSTAAHRLTPLTTAAAVDLITRCAGTSSTTDERAAAEAIALACAHNPLALRTAAARAHRVPGTALTQIAADLSSLPAVGRPNGNDPDSHEIVMASEVMASLDDAYRALPPDAAGSFRKLGLLPDGGFSHELVAAVCGVDNSEGLRLVQLLHAAELVQDGRSQTGQEPDSLPEYDFHDVIRELARERGRDESPAARQEVIRRWAEFLLAAATEAEGRLTPSHRSMPRTYRYGEPQPMFIDISDPQIVEWLDRHRTQLAAAVQAAFERQWWQTAAELVDALWPLFLRRRHRVLWISLLQDYGLPAAEQALARPGISEDETGQGWCMVRRMLTTLAGGLRSESRYTEALDRYRQALNSARHDGHRRDEAQALDGIGAVHQQAGQPEPGIPALLEALRIRQEIGYARGEALTRVRLAEIAADRQQWQEARDHLDRARAALLGVHDPYDAARALAIRGRVEARGGDIPAGEHYLLQAEQEFAATGSLHWRARCREWLGDAAHAAGRTRQAAEHFAASRDLYEFIASPTDLARLDRALREIGPTGGRP